MLGDLLSNSKSNTARVVRAAFSAVAVAMLCIVAFGAERVETAPAKPTQVAIPAANGSLLKIEKPSVVPSLPSPSAPSNATGELLHDIVPDFRNTSAPSGRMVFMEVTAYCACSKCCGPNAIGITASGKRVSYNGGQFAAADTSVLPFGTKLVVPGYGGDKPVEVIDRGGAIKGNRLDLFFPTHQQALEWGRRMVLVKVVER